MKTMMRRIAACAIAGMLALSALITPAMAVSEQNVLQPGQEGFVSLDQYITPTSVPGVYEISLAVGARLEPKPMDIIIILDESGTMLSGFGNSDRWAGAKEGANLAIDTFFDPEINAGYDMTRVAAFSFGSTSPGVVNSALAGPGFSGDGFGGYQDKGALKAHISSKSSPPSATSNMSSAMDITMQLFQGARTNHFLANYPNKSYGTSFGGQAGQYESDVKRYVIFLSDGSDDSPSTSRAMIDYVTELKMPPPTTPGANDQFGVKFYTIGVALGQAGVSHNSEASGFGSSIYADWNKRRTIDPLSNYQPYTNILTTAGYFSAGEQVNEWIYEEVDSANGLVNPAANGQSRQKLFTGGYFDIPGDQFPTYTGAGPRSNFLVGTMPPVYNDPAQTLIYTAMGIDPTKSSVSPSYSGGALAGSTPGSFYATPFDSNAGGPDPINAPDSVIAKAAAGAAANNSVGLGLAPLGLTGISPNTVLAYYNRDTWDGRTPEFYMADTSSELNNSFETIARRIVSFGRDIQTTATLTEQFELYTGFADAPTGVKVSGAKQDVSVNGNSLSWTMDSIPRNSVNRMTMYVKVKPGTYGDGLSYRVLKDLNISYIDDQNFFSNGIAVDTPVTKSFPAVHINPSEATIENNGYGFGSGDKDIIQSNDSQGQVMTNHGPSFSNTQGSQTSLGNPSGSVIFAGVDVNIPTYTSSTKRATIAQNGAKMYQKTTSGTYKAVATLKEGSSFSILSEDGDYYKVLYMKKDAKKASIGYIRKKDTLKSQTPSSAPSPTPTTLPSTK